VLLYDGYDWRGTRKTIEEETRAMRRRLAKIRQMLASGQAFDPSVEDTSALLYNSVYVGLEDDIEGMDRDALIAVIDEELEDDFEVASQSSWQTLVPTAATKVGTSKPGTKRWRLTRSRNPSIEFRLMGLALAFDQYKLDEPFASRTLASVRDVQILDHIKTSTWKMFLTDLHTDLRGIVRESDSDMVRLEIRNVRPVLGNPAEEARLRVSASTSVGLEDTDFAEGEDPPASPARRSRCARFYEKVLQFPGRVRLTAGRGKHEHR
jgi:autophagy-related protein 2